MKFLHRPHFPYLFALCMPVTVYAHNQSAFAVRDVLRPILLALLATVCLVWLLRRLVPDRVLAGLFASVPVVAMWLVGFDWPLYLILALLSVTIVAARGKALRHDEADRTADLSFA